MRRTLNFVNSADKRVSPVAMICAARIPALRPPLMATVATGTPGGICTMESSESSPSVDFAQNRHADDRQGRERRRDARQVRRTARTADDDFQTALNGTGNILFKSAWIAVGGNHFGLAGDAEFRQCISSGLHDGPVGVAAHQNSDERFGGWLVLT